MMSRILRCLRGLASDFAAAWFILAGKFRDERKDWVTIQVSILEWEVAKACECPEMAEECRANAIETINRIGKYYGRRKIEG